MSKTVAVAEFEAHPLELLEEAAEKQEDIVVIRGGKAIGKLAPMTKTRPMTLDDLRASGKIVGDIESPMDGWEMIE
jgi:antitoxin (DNA-binding transcriptional repressor) of toxin-antitoxin stability system